MTSLGGMLKCVLGITSLVLRCDISYEISTVSTWVLNNSIKSHAKNTAGCLFFRNRWYSETGVLVEALASYEARSPLRDFRGYA